MLDWFKKDKHKRRAAEILSDSVDAKLNAFVEDSMKLSDAVEGLSQEIHTLKGIIEEKNVRIHQLERIIQDGEEVLDREHGIFNRYYWENFLKPNLTNEVVAKIDTKHKMNLDVVARMAHDGKNKETFVYLGGSVILIIFGNNTIDTVYKKMERFKSLPFDLELTTASKIK